MSLAVWLHSKSGTYKRRYPIWANMREESIEGKAEYKYSSRQMYCASLGIAVTKTFIYFQSLKVQLWHRNLLDSLQLAIQMIKHLSNHFPSTHILISNINSMLLSNCRMKDNTETAVTLSSLRKQNSKILMLQVNAKRLNTWKKKI